MQDLNFSKYIHTVNEYSTFLEKNISSDLYYYQAYNSVLKNKINNYINYLNLSLIYNYFSSYKKLHLLDLGSGVGDKSYFIKYFFPTFKVYGLETINHDDPEHKKNKPHEFFGSIYKKINKKFGLNLRLYNGKHIPKYYKNFDVIMLYAVIEHIAPKNRFNFIKSIEKRLNRNGYFIITRCPRRFGLIEYIARNLNLGAHEWVLSKNELLKLFPKNKYSIKLLKIMNNIPNGPYFSNKFFSQLVIIDKILSFLRWPFATDYFLLVKKK
jgi:2-polyprenyl-3-methyl-5-hydroxy-6-metoxy-1,4-benzoquinol methylase